MAGAHLHYRSIRGTSPVGSSRLFMVCFAQTAEIRRRLGERGRINRSLLPFKSLARACYNP